MRSAYALVFVRQAAPLLSAKYLLGALTACSCSVLLRRAFAPCFCAVLLFLALASFSCSVQLLHNPEPVLTRPCIDSSSLYSLLALLSLLSLCSLYSLCATARVRCGDGRLYELRCFPGCVLRAHP
jgi:hypothetical protein